MVSERTRHDMNPTVPSVCYRIVEIDIKHQRKILKSFVWGGGAWPLRPHSGCASVQRLDNKGCLFALKLNLNAKAKPNLFEKVNKKRSHQKCHVL